MLNVYLQTPDRTAEANGGPWREQLGANCRPQRIGENHGEPPSSQRWKSAVSRGVTSVFVSAAAEERPEGAVTGNRGAEKPPAGSPQR